MKRLKKLIIVLMSLSLTSCGFVNYVEASSSMEQTVVDELTTKRNDYIQKLEETYLEENYESNEKVQLRKCLIEAKAELHECNSLLELEGIYKKNEELIKAIKTKSDYATELADKKKEYISKINDISDESLYREKEKETYLFYVEKAKEAINELGSIKEDFDKVYNAYKNIIEAIKTFDQYKQEAINEINNYQNFDDYRETEANAIKELLDVTAESINKSEDYSDIDALVRRYKTDVYQYETDEQLYNKELLSLIDKSKNEIGSYVNKTNYRENEVAIINTLLDSFISDVDNLKIKEEVTKLVNTYKGLLDAIKTDAQLYEEEKLILINNLFQELKTVINYDSLSEADKEYYDNLYEVLLLLSKKEEVETSVNDEKAKIYKDRLLNGDDDALVPYQLCLIDSLSYYLDKSLYREAQQTEIDSIVTSSYGSILGCTNYNDTIDALNIIKADLDAVLTNDEMWEKEDAEFFVALHDLYGDDILIPEGSLTEANGYYELANIIDYYAFYQIDANTFLRDEFRVKLLFEHQDAKSVKLNTYWKAKLLHANSGFEVFLSGDFLTVRLIPYNTCSVKNKAVECEKNTRTLYYDSFTSKTETRTESDLPSYSFPKVSGVWNSNQVWYCLENGFYPNCVENSSAEIVLDKMVDILCEINESSYSDEKKFFNIFQWIGQNVQFNNNYETEINYGQTLDPYNYPDEIFSLYRDITIEGALLDNYAICYGFAKLLDAMTNLEGIECKFVIARSNMQIGMDSLDYFNNGGVHCVCFVKLGDYWFESDPAYSNFSNQHNYFYPNYSRIIMSTKELYPYRVSECEVGIAESICDNYEVYYNFYNKIVFEDGRHLMYDSEDKIELGDNLWLPLIAPFRIDSHISKYDSYSAYTSYFESKGIASYILLPVD